MNNLLRLFRTLIPPTANRVTKAERDILKKTLVNCGKIGKNISPFVTCNKTCSEEFIQECPFIERQQHENQQQIKDIISLLRDRLSENPTSQEIRNTLELILLSGRVDPNLVNKLEKIEAFLEKTKKEKPKKYLKFERKLLKNAGGI